MRTLKELLIALRDYVMANPYKYSGLCVYIACLAHRDIITLEEEKVLNTFIRDNKPKRFRRFYKKACKNSAWYWEAYDAKIRVKWLNYHINKLK